MTVDDELVLVDDGSADASSAIAIAIARDPRVALLHSGGVGISGALRCGLAASRGEWIARMDSDDISLPGRLAAERKRLEADPTLGVIGTQVEVFGTHVGDGIRRYVAWQNSLITPEDHARSIYVESPVCHPSTMLRRTALESVGGFADGPFAEDYDLWLRLVAAGWRIAKVPSILLRWRIHGRNTTFSDPRLSISALRRLRARHLAKRIDRPFAIWGAGREGSRLAAALEEHSARPSFFIDIDPRKIGRTRRAAPIVTVSDGLARARREGTLIVVAVAVPGARDIVRAQLHAANFVEGRDFVTAA
jgi:glycosyltransferase involved in cell wall biosynthesis